MSGTIGEAAAVEVVILAWRWTRLALLISLHAHLDHFFMYCAISNSCRSSVPRLWCFLCTRVKFNWDAVGVVTHIIGLRLDTHVGDHDWNANPFGFAIGDHVWAHDAYHCVPCRDRAMLVAKRNAFWKLFTFELSHEIFDCLYPFRMCSASREQSSRTPRCFGGGLRTRPVRCTIYSRNLRCSSAVATCEKDRGTAACA